jgi:hypothetical protein
MAVTHEITNKKNPKNVLRGEVLRNDPFARSTDIIFDFRIDGAESGNAFRKEEWDIEEILALPENLYAVIQFKDTDYDTTRTFWRTDSDDWYEDDSDYYSNRALMDRIKEYGKNKKFEVLFAGVPAKEAAEDEGF